MNYLTRAFALCLLAGTLATTTSLAQRLPKNGTIETTYDRFENKTSVDVTIITAVGPYNSLALFFNGQYGDTPQPPEKLVMMVQSFGMLGFQPWGDTFFVNALIDNTERYKFVLKSPGDAAGQRTIEGAYHVNTLAGWISYADFRKLALGNRVELRLGQTELTLSAGQLQALRSFMKRFKDE